MDRSSKILDDIAQLMNDAAGVADGVRREVETAVKSQMERVVADLDLVKRDDYEALKELVQNQSEEIAQLRKDVKALKSKKKSA
jgi:BMFP domain-containing protein YqiC